MLNHWITRRGLLRVATGFIAAATLATAVKAVPINSSVLEDFDPAEEADSSNLEKIQQGITRFYEATGVPPLTPSEYRVIFTLLAEHAKPNSCSLEEALAIVTRARQEAGLEIAAADIAFVIDTLNTSDYWFAPARSPAVVAVTFREAILCQSYQAGMQPSDLEHQLLEIWLDSKPLPQPL